MLTGGRRKLHPISSANSGIRFPVEACCGKCDPQQSIIPSHGFPNRPQAEAASHNPPPNRDTLSGGLDIRPQPTFRSQSDHICIVWPSSNGTHPFSFSAPARSQAAVHPRYPDCYVAVEGRTGKPLKTIRRPETPPFVAPEEQNGGASLVEDVFRGLPVRLSGECVRYSAI